MGETISRNLGSVVGPRGEKGPKGDTYVLTQQDKEDIANIVGTENYLPNAKLKIDCYNLNTSSYPTVVDYVWDGTCTVKDIDGNTIATFPLNGQRIEMPVAPYTRWKVICSATGFQTASEQTIIVTSEGVVVDFPLTPSTTTYYTVKWKDANGVTKHQVQLLPHESAVYEGSDPEVEGKIWMGWDGSADDVISDKTINATYITPVLPDEPVDVSEFDYVYSDTDEYTSAYSLDEFCGILMSERPQTYLAIGDKFLITKELSSRFDEAMEYILLSFKHFKLADESGWAKTTWQMNVQMKTTQKMNNTNTNVGGWESCLMRTTLNTTIFNDLPKFLRALIKTVRVKSTIGDMRSQTSVSLDKVYLLSYSELGFSSSGDVYHNEVEEGANEYGFSIFTSNPSRVKYRWARESAPQYWWLRSPYLSSSSGFWYVNNSGASNGNAAASFSVACSFSI